MHLQPGTFTQKSEVICTLNKIYYHILYIFGESATAYRHTWTRHNLWILLILCRDVVFIILNKTCQNYQTAREQERGKLPPLWCWVNNRPSRRDRSLAHLNEDQRTSSGALTVRRESTCELHKSLTLKKKTKKKTLRKTSHVSHGAQDNMIRI